MNDRAIGAAYWAKARESLATAENEYAHRRYNSCANRCYYACFQAAVAALIQYNIGTRDPSGRWGHDYVQATFVGQLIKRRKLYPSSLSETLNRNHELRQLADYKVIGVTQKQADRALRRSREFVQVIEPEVSSNEP